MINLNQIRNQQVSIQVATIRPSANQPQAVTYLGRDQVSGLRILQSADGGIIKANYLSANEPQAHPVVVSNGSIGVPGTITSR
jgi:hypothetical protein